MIGASGSQPIDLSFISPNRVIPKCFKKWCPQLGAQRNSVENKPANLLAVSLGKALNKISPSLRDRQVAGASNLSAVVARSN